MNPKASGSSAAVQGVPVCCVVFVFYNQEHEVEPMLQPFLEALGQLPVQIVIYDDGSTDGTHFVVESLIGQVDSDHIVFHKHDLRRGTGMCLNLALEDSPVKAFYYVDKHIDLNAEAFAAVLRELSYSQAAFTFPASNPALDPTQLAVKHASKKKVPASINYIIRKDRIRPDRLFFNPFLQNGHSAELLMRAGVSAKALEAPTFFQLPYNEEVYSDLTSQDSRLIIFHSQLSSTEVRGVGSQDDPDLLYEKAEALKADGRITAALELCDDILKKFPRHQHSLRLSVELLKRLKKYIEASERAKMIGQGVEPEAQVTTQKEERAPALRDDEDASSKPLDHEPVPVPVEVDEIFPAETGLPVSEGAGGAEPEEEALTEPFSEPKAREDDVPEDDDLETKSAKNAGDTAVAATEEDSENEYPEAGLTADETTDAAEDASDKSESAEEADEPESEQRAVPESEDERESEPEPEPEAEVPYVRPEAFRHSIIVPIAGFAMPAIEKLAISLHNFCDPADTELIIVDNACLDESWEYLQQMAEYHFFHARVITNPVNKGFTHAVNQGLKLAEGEYQVVMHADVTFRSDVVRQLADVLEANPDAAVVGPVTTDCMQEEQIRAVSLDVLETAETSWVDGFCFAMRAADDYRLDERFHYAWYETVDLCYRVQDEGRSVLIAAGVLVNHQYGLFTTQLGMPLYSDEFQRSLEVFSQKWVGEPALPQPGTSAALDELWELGALADPLKPSAKIKSRIAALLTNETETALKTLTDVTDYDLRNFIRALMVVNSRGLMRELEERLSGLPDPGFGVELLRFYFQHQIFSRCKKYIEMIHDQQPQLALLYALRIASKENDAELAPQYLSDYLEAYPASAEAYVIGAKMHAQHGNDELAASFLERAQQLDPFNREDSRASES